MSPNGTKWVVPLELQEYISNLKPGPEKEAWVKLLTEIDRLEKMTPEEREQELKKADEEISLTAHQLRLLKMTKEERERELKKLQEVAQKTAEEAEKEWQETLAGMAAILVEEDIIRRKAEIEALKKIAFVEHFDKLIENFKEFLSKKDLPGCSAVIKKITLSGRLPSLLNYYGYPSNWEGMHNFFNEIIISVKPISGERALENFLFQQRVLAVEYEASCLAEGLNQWSLSCVVGRKARIWYQFSEKDHLLAVVHAILKISPEKAARFFGPSAYGFWLPREKFNLKAGRDFEFGPEGKLICLAFADIFEKQLIKKEFNSEAVEVLSDNIDEIKMIGIKDSFIEALQKYFKELVKPEQADEVWQELSK